MGLIRADAGSEAAPAHLQELPGVVQHLGVEELGAKWDEKQGLIARRGAHWPPQVTPAGASGIVLVHWWPCGRPLLTLHLWRGCAMCATHLACGGAHQVVTRDPIMVWVQVSGLKGVRMLKGYATPCTW